MTYATTKTEYGRKLAIIVRIRLPLCALEFGVGACPAVLGAGTKCFNTFNTCPVQQAYDGTAEQVLTFVSEFIPNLQQPGEAAPFPFLGSVDTAPTILAPGEGLGVRASCTVQLTDAPWTDIGTDPYAGDPSRPDVVPELTGTIIAKIIKRHKYFENRTIEVLTGYLDENGGYDAANFRTRSYLIDKITGPDARGRINIKARDPLRLADGDRSSCPRLSSGALAANITDVATVLQLGSGQAQEYVDLGTEWVRLGGEVMQVVSINAGLDQISVARATLPSFYETGENEASDHDEGTTVQHCELYYDVRIDDVLHDLLTRWAGIPASYIDSPAWVALADTWLSALFCRRLITEPTPVKTLLVELTQHLAMLWWDDRTQKIRLDALRPGSIGSAPPTWTDDDHLLEEAPSVERSSDRRLSRVFVYFGYRNPLDPGDKPASFRRGEFSVDLDTELDEQYGSIRQKVIYSKWLTSAQRGVALEIAGRLLNEYKNSKMLVTVNLDPKDDDTWTGDRFNLSTRTIIDTFGRPEQAGFIVLEATEQLTSKGARYVYKGLEVAVTGRVAAIAPDFDPTGVLVDTDGAVLVDTNGQELVDNLLGGVFPNYENASQLLRNNFAFISNNDGLMPNGDPGYVIG